jgi:hypothetical protein
MALQHDSSSLDLVSYSTILIIFDKRCFIVLNIGFLGCQITIPADLRMGLWARAWVVLGHGPRVGNLFGHFIDLVSKTLEQFIIVLIVNCLV